MQKICKRRLDLKIDGLTMDLEEDFLSVHFLGEGGMWCLIAPQLQVRSIENAEKNPKEIDNWARNSDISMAVELHRAGPWS